jgi:hypothetical protein
MTTTIYTKKCPKCKEIKSINEFNKQNSRKDGHQSTCILCNKQYRIDNKEYFKQYNNSNKEYFKQKHKEYYNSNKEYCIQYHKEYMNSFALYKTYTHQLTIEEEPRLADDGVSLEVKCKYCGRYHKPTNSNIGHRIRSISGITKGEKSLYCSTNCKKSCGTYNRSKYPKGFKTNTSREVQPELRKLVLERDDWKCQTCGKIDVQLHCHHYEGIEINPTESADMDNCITLCNKCHNKLHKDCDMRRKKC